MASPERITANVDRRAVIRGALVGLALIVPVTAVGAILDRAVDDFDDTAGVGVLFVALLGCFAGAGWVASRRAGAAPLTNGALAALGALVLWLPIRVVIWLVRDDSRGLVRGDDAALPGQLLGIAVFATLLGMAGAVVAARQLRRSAR